MKSYNTLYYLLSVLLITGAFASMAQNSYGLTILGGVSIAFGLLFLVQGVRNLRKKQSTYKRANLELFALFLLSFLFSLRILYIHFPYVEWVFAFAGGLLGIYYFFQMIQTFNLY